MLPDFAHHVRASHAEIIDRWLVAVRGDEGIPRARELNEADLRDHLDGVLNKLVRLLAQSAALSPERDIHAPAEATIHGAVRSQQQYRVDELVREVGVLRSSFMEFFSEYLKVRRQIETEEFLRVSQLVHRFFDEICTESVSGYVQARESEASQQAESLRALNCTLETTNRQYEQADSYRRRTLRTVAHEMATPVNALGLGVTYLAESVNAEERQEAKTLVSRTLEHLRTMLEQLFDFSRMEGGVERLHVREFELQPLFDYLLLGFEPLAAAKGLQLHARLDPSLDGICNDEHKVQRIAANLLSNAIKYCDTGSVTLNMAPMNEETWVLEVLDTGYGIPPDDLDRIFSEFERLPRHADQPGLGLGLTIVRTLVERLNGRLSLESTVGKGSHFRVELPRRLPVSLSAGN